MLSCFTEWCLVVSSSLSDFVVSHKSDAYRFASFNFSWLYRIERYQEFDCFGFILFFHSDDLCNIRWLAEDARKFGLIHDVVYLFKSHAVEKTYSGVSEVHISKVSGKPFLSVLTPNSNKIPCLAISFICNSKSELVYTSGNILSLLLDL